MKIKPDTEKEDQKIAAGETSIEKSPKNQSQ